MRVYWRRCSIGSLFFTIGTIYIFVKLFPRPNFHQNEPSKDRQRIIVLSTVIPVTNKHIEEKPLPFPKQPVLKPMIPPPKSDQNSVGPGEHGAPYATNQSLLSPKEQLEYSKGWDDNAYNLFASDRISVRRYIPDTRETECKTKKYHTTLPQTSVVICFHNEGWSVLLRSIHSVIDNSPAHLLKEIILVDDFSNQAHLMKPLEDYVKQLRIVRIIRAPRREGLIRARLMGYRASTGEVVTFLDSHIECTQGWLEPLLDRIQTNRNNVPFPLIEVINDDTFELELTPSSTAQIGIFDWSLTFDWHPPSRKDVQRPGAPFSPLRSPTMPGGLFSIHREFFERLGLYDPGMEIWGAENLELSFKTWMCGGAVELIPCSRVGHIFRTRSPYSWDSKSKQPLVRNSVRLAEVWMDQYKNIYYEKINYELGDFGDVSDRKALRDRLKCRSFQWYLDTLLPDMFNPVKAVCSGDIANRATRVCADAESHEGNTVAAFPCHGQKGNQLWFLSHRGEIRNYEYCWDSGVEPGKVVLKPCHNVQGNQMFEYTQDNHIRQWNNCLELSANGSSLHLVPCVPHSSRQLWNFLRKPLTLKGK